MSETEALVERLQRANRRWKALALVACSALILMSLAWSASIYSRRVALERRNAELLRAAGVGEGPAKHPR
jgi:hypothetical protein